MRSLITFLIIAISVVFVMAIFQARTPPTSPTTPAVTPDPTPLAPGESPGAPETPPETPPEVSPDQAPQPTANTNNQPLGTFTVVPGTFDQSVTLGDNDPDSPFKLKVDLTHLYPAIKRISLTDFKTKPRGGEPYVVQQVAEQGPYIIYPLMPSAITLNGQTIDLFAVKWNLVHDKTATRMGEAITYGLSFVDEAGRVVLEVHREFRLDVDSYDLTVNQRFINHSDQPLKIVWETLTQGDAPLERSTYARDERFLITAYYNPSYDPKRIYIFAKDAVLPRTGVLDTAQQKNQPIWPNPELDQEFELVWFAVVNRYFGIAVHPVPTVTDDATTFTALHSTYQKITTPIILGQLGQKRAEDGRKMVLAMTSRPFEVPPYGSRNLDFDFFAGPRSSELFARPPYEAMGFSEMLVYTLGCTLCTFQPVARGLLWVLKVLHAVVFDWGVAIILLVCCVRILLHPITKRAQINMMKMGKQTQALQPEIAKIKKKYGDDKTKIGQETMRLYRERGVNPVSGMLGCLPMMLQMPIWVALYAMLYTAIELRHQPALYGVFQAVFGESLFGQFLLDLAAPDRFCTFFDEPRYFQFFFFNFDYSSFNIIPILMGVVFFVQQKLTMTPATTDDMRRQQKIMAIMMPLLFPLMMYSVPSGLTLYILTSTGIGIIESYIVRKHIKEQEEAGLLFGNQKSTKSPKPGGFMDRLQKAVEAKQKQKQLGSDSGGGSKHYKQRKRP